MEDKLKYFKELKKGGKTLYRLAKDLDVSYATVRAWDKGFFMPSEHNILKMKALLGASK